MQTQKTKPSRSAPKDKPKPKPTTSKKKRLTAKKPTKPRKRKAPPKRFYTPAEHHAAALDILELDTIAAMKKLCRERFPRVVEFLDTLTAEETQIIARRRNIRSLSEERKAAFREAMEADDFRCI